MVQLTQYIMPEPLCKRNMISRQHGQALTMHPRMLHGKEFAAPNRTCAIRSKMLDDAFFGEWFSRKHSSTSDKSPFDSAQGTALWLLSGSGRCAFPFLEPSRRAMVDIFPERQQEII